MIQDIEIRSAIQRICMESVATVISDPGNAGAIRATTSGTCLLIVGAAPETRTVGVPSFVGQVLVCCIDVTGGGTCSITPYGHAAVTLAHAGDTAILRAVRSGGVNVWRVTGSEL